MLNYRKFPLEQINVLQDDWLVGCLVIIWNWRMSATIFPLNVYFLKSIDMKGKDINGYQCRQNYEICSGNIFIISFNIVMMMVDISLICYCPFVFFFFLLYSLYIHFIMK